MYSPGSKFTTTFLSSYFLTKGIAGKYTENKNKNKTNSPLGGSFESTDLAALRSLP